MGDSYTHGHHESVLRSHTWRTAENSAAYLLRVLAPGRVLGIDASPEVIAPHATVPTRTPVAGCSAASRGLTSTEELTAIAAAWQRWAQSPDGCFIVVHGEVLARA